jgi:hypothetical protein
VRKRSAVALAIAVLVMPLLHADAAVAVTCASSVGPGIPPPAAVASGIAGFHAAWYGQSGYMSLCPGTESTATVAYYNTGSRGWVAGASGQTAYLGTADPSPGQDQPSTLGGDGTNGSPATGWPRYNRLAIQPAPYVGPGQVAWFQFRVRAPLTPGRYSIALRPVIEGAQWLEDYGVFWSVVVLNPDGSQPPVTIGGLTFNPTATARADVYIETTISSSDATSLISVVDGDIASIETTYGRSFGRRPILFAFGSNATATGGNLTIAHMPPSDATFLATNEGGYYSPLTGDIFLNWFNLQPSERLRTPRHELTHQLIAQIAGPNTAVPAWLNEGSARLQEMTIAGEDWWANLNAATARSAVALVPSQLIPLADLESQAVWNARPDPLANFEYYEASEAVRLLRQDVGVSGTILMLDLMRQGVSFDAAFLTVTGHTAGTFEAAFPSRLAATTATYPAVLLAGDTPAGAGVSLTAYGFAPSSSLSVTIRTPGYVPATFPAVADTFGAYTTYVTVARGWPASGTYTVAVTDGSRTATAMTTLGG